MQRYFSNNKQGNYFILNDDDIRHIKVVMRYHDGDEIEVVYNSTVFLCCLENVKSDIKIRILEEMESNYKSQIKVCLIIPLLRENKMDLIIQKATELGVAEIMPVVMERCNIKVEKHDDKKMLRWKRIAKEASEQAKRVDIPIINQIKELKEIEFSDGINIVCSTVNHDNNLKNVLQNMNTCDNIRVVIGPEGGLSPKEEDLLNKKGFISITLGTNILRVETVPIFVLSVFNYELWSDKCVKSCK